MKTLNISIIIIAIIMVIPAISFSQNCHKKKYLKDQYEDYDFKSQSSYATLSPGDTSNLKIVIYSGLDYRFMVEADPSLGEIEYKIVKNRRKYKKVVKEVNKTYPEPEYAVDEYGDYITDEYGDFTEIEQEPILDTVWTKKPYTDKEVIFDSKKGEKPNFDKTFKKSQSMDIEVYVPDGDPTTTACVNVLIGRKKSNSTSFKQNKVRVSQ